MKKQKAINDMKSGDEVFHPSFVDNELIKEATDFIIEHGYCELSFHTIIPQLMADFVERYISRSTDNKPDLI
jgi:hypothetical protein